MLTIIIRVIRCKVNKQIGVSDYKNVVITNPLQIGYVILRMCNGLQAMNLLTATVKNVNMITQDRIIVYRMFKVTLLLPVCEVVTPHLVAPSNCRTVVAAT